MRYAEAMKLKAGDLVVLDHRIKKYGGLVLEVTDDPTDERWCWRVTLKQPGFDSGFRIPVDSRYLKRYEP